MAQQQLIFDMAIENVVGLFQGETIPKEAVVHSLLAIIALVKEEQVFASKTYDSNSP